MENCELENRVECFVTRLPDENQFVGDGSDDIVDGDELYPPHSRDARRDELERAHVSSAEVRSSTSRSPSEARLLELVVLLNEGSERVEDDCSGGW